MTKATVQRIARTAKKMQPFQLVLTDGQSSVPVAEVRTSKGFLHACRTAVKQYSGTFKNLELPNWKIVCGADSVILAKLND